MCRSYNDNNGDYDEQNNGPSTEPLRMALENAIGEITSHLKIMQTAQGSATAKLDEQDFIFRPLSLEGTTVCDSQLFGYDQETAMNIYDEDKVVKDQIAPSVNRMLKTLRSSRRNNGKHAFYKSFVEWSISMKSPLMQSKWLAQMSKARCHFRFLHTDPRKQHQSGATPKDLYEGTFALKPMWEAGTDNAEILKTELDRYLLNVMPRREFTRLHPLEVENYQANVRTLETFVATNFQSNNEPHGVLDDYHQTLHVLTVATLVYGKHLIENFTQSLTTMKEKNTLKHVNLVATDIPNLFMLENYNELQNAYTVTPLEQPSKVVTLRLFTTPLAPTNPSSKKPHWMFSWLL
jgi:hypothetical protein